MQPTTPSGNKVLKSAVHLALLMAASAGPALGQAADPKAGAQPAAAGDNWLEEVVVTAQRREEDILKVPYNITAVSGQYLDDYRVVSQADLIRSVPGASIVDRGYRNSGVISGISIRGVNTNRSDQGDMALSAVPSVSTYVNDTPIFANFLLKDLERVEVLRGPQGTLYGSGSLGGTIRYITNRPELDRFSGRVEGSLSQTDGSGGTNWSADGVVNIPMGKMAALRIAASTLDLAGTIDYPNVYKLDSNGIPVAPKGELDPTAEYRKIEDADTVNIDYVRAALLLQPNESFSATLTYVYQTDETGGRRAATRGSDGYGNKYGEYENGSIQREPSSRDVSLVSLEMPIDVGFATLTSSTSYYDTSGKSKSDNTGFYANQRFGGWLQYYDTYPRPMAQADRRYSDSSFIQEIRLVSNAAPASHFDYVVGAFYQSQDLTASQFSYLRGLQQYAAAKYPPPQFVISDQDFNYQRSQTFDDTAVYGELTYRITDQWSVTGGMRYYWNSNDSKFKNFFSGACNTNGANANASICWYPRDSSPNYSIKQDDDGSLFKVNVAYLVTDYQTLYATFSQGYRRGGANIVPPEGTTFGENPAWQTYKPDNLNNYEVGFKGAADTFRYSIALFYVDWQDIQVDTTTTNWGFYVAQNGQDASSQGVELELEGGFLENWHYHLGYAYTDAKLDQPVLRPFPVAATGVYPVVGKAGTSLPGTPENTFNAALDHTWSFSGGLDWTNRVSAYYQSSTENSIFTDNGTPTSAFNASRYQHTWPGYSIWDLFSTLGRDEWSATFFVKNVFNAAGVSGGFLETAWGTSPANNFYGNDAKVQLSLPRTIGVSATYKF
jgi:outer membrane receptor protein involved in Fe transport